MAEYYNDRTCACGHPDCGGLIEIKPCHKYNGIPKYINGHTWKGKKLTEETKKKMSDTHKGMKHTEETKKKMSDTHKGKKCLEETKKKISDTMKDIEFTDEHRKNISDSMKGKKCSEETKKKISDNHADVSGPNNPNYNPDITDEEREKGRFINRKESIEWRKSVFEKDNYTCQICGQVGCNLNAHHIFSWNTHREFRFLLSNGATMCEGHHKEFHKKYGKGKNNLEQYLEYKIDYKLGG